MFPAVIGRHWGVSWTGHHFAKEVDENQTFYLSKGHVFHDVMVCEIESHDTRSPALTKGYNPFILCGHSGSSPAAVTSGCHRR